MRGAALLCLLLWSAQMALADAGDVLRGFAEDLYATSEATGGSPEVWDRLEEQALSGLAQAQSLTAPGDRGRTPLMVAAANGYGFAVRWLLARPEVRATLDARDDDGLNAWDLAQLALRQTAFACRPRVQNAAVVVPVMAGLPYYLYRQPYPGIANALAGAGADTGTAELRAHWLSVCPRSAPDLRAAIARGAPVQPTLMAGARDVLLAKCSEEARLKHRSILRMFGQRADAAGVIAQSRDITQARIAACETELEGFLPD